MPKSQKRAVIISLGDRLSFDHATPTSLDFLKDRGYSFFEITLPWSHPLKRFASLLRYARFIYKSDLVLTSEYFNAGIIAAILKLSRSSTKHAVIGLNVSTNRILRTKYRLINHALNQLFFDRIDIAAVASKPEAAIFSDIHSIPLNRFTFVRWAYDLPDLQSNFKPPNRPYFCLIGRNNRDHATFCTALEQLDADGVIISNIEPNHRLPENIKSYVDLSLGDCIACIKSSVANVLLVQDSERGAGHITIVTAMHCARPQIISHVDTALDYFIPDEHAITVPMKNSKAVKSAMLKLLNDPTQANRMGMSAQAYAQDNLSHSRRTKLLGERLQRWIDTGVITWNDEIQSIEK